MKKRYRISGIILETETERPLPDLIVRAYDKDPVFDDLLGFATTNEDGRFEIRYSEQSFQDVREKRPDLYLRVFEPSGARLIHETTEAIRWNASPAEEFRILISGTALLPPRRGSPPAR